MENIIKAKLHKSWRKSEVELKGRRLFGQFPAKAINISSPPFGRDKMKIFN